LITFKWSWTYWKANKSIVRTPRLSIWPYWVICIINIGSDSAIGSNRAARPVANLSLQFSMSYQCYFEQKLQKKSLKSVAKRISRHDVGWNRGNARFVMKMQWSIYKNRFCVICTRCDEIYQHILADNQSRYFLFQSPILGRVVLFKQIKTEKWKPSENKSLTPHMELISWAFAGLANQPRISLVELFWKRIVNVAFTQDDRT
jgi:hypothetical protein